MFCNSQLRGMGRKKTKKKFCNHKSGGKNFLDYPPGQEALLARAASINSRKLSCTRTGKLGGASGRGDQSMAAPSVLHKLVTARDPAKPGLRANFQVQLAH